MPYIDVALANAWTDGDRLNLTDINVKLENQIASQVIQRASRAFDTATWENSATLVDLVMGQRYMLEVVLLQIIVLNPVLMKYILTVQVL